MVQILVLNSLFLKIFYANICWQFWKGNKIWNNDKIEPLYLDCTHVVTIPLAMTQEHLPQVCDQGVVLEGMHQGVVQVGVVHHVLEMSLGVVLLVVGKVQGAVLCMAH